MLRKCLYLLSLSILFFSCDKQEKEAMQKQIDSLNIELERSQQMSQTLTEVGTLMDSIDASRQMLRVNMVEGTTYDDYASRMKDLNAYIKETSQKIASLEKNLKGSNANARKLANTIQQLKAALQQKSNDVAALEEQVEKYRNENANLISTVDLQEKEISSKQAQIEAKEQELALIEARVQELMIQAKVSEADAYYTRALAVEEVANRTKLAPRKKKETLKEAVELYKKALSLGKEEAQARITELEKRL